MNILGEQYLSVTAKISAIQRYIIIHSILYYVKDTSVISDKEFDKVARDLVKYKRLQKEAYKKSDYFYCMKDFDGTTGFDLYDRLTKSDKVYLSKIADYILFLRRENGNGN